MLRHIVLVRFASETSDVEQLAIMQELAALRSTIPEIVAFAHGRNVSEEGRSAGFSHVFSMDFMEEAARDAYLRHPAHMAVAGRLVEAADGPGGILVADFHIA